MYCYKLNNSYTIYVNYQYYTECHKICEKKKKKAKEDMEYCLKKIAAAEKKNTAKAVTQISPQKQKPQTAQKTVPKNTAVKHAVFGKGRILSISKDGYMSVLFGDRARTFLYPSAFTQGYLVRA